MSSVVRWRKVAIYFAIAFSFTYGTAMVFVLVGGSFTSADWVKLAPFGMLGPSVAAIVVQRLIYREPLREPLGLSLRMNRWWLVAWLASIPLCLATLGLSLLLPQMHYDPSMRGVIDVALMTPEQHAQLIELARSLSIHPFVLIFIPPLVLGPTLSLIGGAGEEIGWRGFLYRETLALGFARQCLVIGPMWYAWHAPLPLLGVYSFQDPVLGSVAMFSQIMLLTPLFNYVRLRSGSSIAAGLFHGALGASAGIAVAPVAGGSGLLKGIQSFPFCAVLLVANVVLFAYDRFLAKEPVIARRPLAGERAPAS